MNHQCKGCQSFDVRLQEPVCSLQYRYESIPNRCPCSICLIKGICKCECKEFVDFCNKAGTMIREGNK